MQHIQMQLRDWLNTNSNGWANALNSKKCQRARKIRVDSVTPTRDFEIFNYENHKHWGTTYSVCTAWAVTQRNIQVEIDLCLYPTQEALAMNNEMQLHQEGYEVRIYVRYRVPPNCIPIIKGACTRLARQEGFQDVSHLNDNPVDYNKVFHKPVTINNIISDIAPYVGPLHGGGQHLEPYIRDIIYILLATSIPS